MLRIKVSYSCLLLLATALVLLTSCAHSGGKTDPLHDLADKLARDDVGAVVEVKNNGPTVPIIVFEEAHASVHGQIEIAIMLNRLCQDYGVTLIGTEGAYAPLDVTWYHTQFQEDLDAQSAVMQQLAEGEISSTELIALLYPGVTVQGLEDQAEYEANLADAQAGGGAIWYLLAFAAQNMSKIEREQADQIRTGQGEPAYIDYVLSFDEWSQARYAALYGHEATPAGDLVAILDDIIQRADQMNLDALGDFTVHREALSREHRFLTGVDQRTTTMFDGVRGLAGTQPDLPLPVIIGVSHTPHLVELLDQAGYSYIVLQAASLEDALLHDTMMLDDAAVARRFVGQSVDTDTGLGAFLDERDGAIRPLPTAKGVLVQQKTACYTAFRKLSALLHTNVTTANLPLQLVGLDIALKTIEQKGVRIESVELVNAAPAQPDSNPALVFHVTVPEATGLDGESHPEETFWAKVTFVDEEQPSADIEQQLFQMRHDVTAVTQGSSVISVAADTLAVVGRTREAVVLQAITGRP